MNSNSWTQLERARQVLAKEVGHSVKPHGDRLRVALAFPNTYWVGMSNLGFQTVYRLLNAENDVVCERFFLPPKQELADLVATRTPLVTLESQTPVGDFDVVAFSGRRATRSSSLAAPSHSSIRSRWRCLPT